MKKNIMMRAASVLLVAVLLTTCAISGTFAKYVTSDSGSDSARVAKFGVTITAATDMFHDSYKETYTTYTDDEELATITVQADSEGTDVLAPGTNGTLAGFAVTGTPEVDVQVTYVADLVLTNWEISGDEYCPVVFTVEGTEYKIDGSTITTVADLETAVESAIAACGTTYHTNTDLSAVDDDADVTWAWPFSTSAENDVKDTFLGDQAAAGNAATVQLTVTTTITQID